MAASDEDGLNAEEITRALSLRVNLEGWKRSARTAGSSLRLARLAHLFTDALALAAFLGARLHDFALALLALLGAATARLGAGLMGIMDQRARASRQAGGESAERLTVHGQFMGFGVVLAVLRVFFGKLFETVVSGFVADLGTLRDRLDVIAHVSDSLAVRARLRASRQQEPSGPRPE
jgi:hypothetical protein